ncbi:hypothetical protein [Sphingomonas beigongshangi]|uniref:hypothetical protein n=1 Tax=Sphingomonas beigongshangi TaxID=2782540 RepID=UPI00193B0D2A|nr:hypothetical protein [Sphingomonas beigongshangi]
MQTRIIAAGLGRFEGDVDRFAIFALIMRETLRGGSRTKGISMHSMAISLSRSFETVRRHVKALISAELCARVQGGVVVHPDVFTRPDIQRLMTLTHDSFVAFAQGLRDAGELPPIRAAAEIYLPTAGIGAAVDVMLGTVESNRAIHGSWLDLVLFSTILCGNLDRQAALCDAPTDPNARIQFSGVHAIRASTLTRVLNLPETTVRRRLTRLSAAGGPVQRLRQGFVIHAAWMNREDAVETSARTASTVRLALAAAAVQGFPFDRIESAYLDGPPPPVAFDNRVAACAPALFAAGSCDRTRRRDDQGESIGAVAMRFLPDRLAT